VEQGHPGRRALRAGVPVGGGNAGLIVRAAEPRDARQVAAIYAHYVAGSAATFEETAPDDEQTAAKIADIQAIPLPFLVAETDGRIDGYAYLSRYIERSAYRHTAECSVYVAPERRAAGVGRALMERLLEEGERLGIRQVIAIVAVTDDPAPVALPRSFGFREAGRLERVGFKLGRWYDTVLLQRSLG
jgi:L-amino acid N-acyltransferase YncA